MHRRLLFSGLLAIFAVSFAGCTKREDESSPKKGPLPRGAETTEVRQVQSFDALIADGRVDVRVQPGESKEARLSGPDNYLKLITLEHQEQVIEGQTMKVLIATLAQGVRLPLPQIELTAPQLKYIEARGPARVKLGNLSGSALTIKAGEATKVELDAATYGQVKIEATMGARVLAPEVMAERAELSAADISFVQVGQVGQLLKRAQGGKISYKGKPELLQP